MAVFFYFYEYFIRVSPSVMTTPLMNSFGVQAGIFGFVSAFYLYTYSAMQIPVGIAVDRYGARLLLTIGAILVGVGSIVFSLTTHVYGLAIGRLFQGIGSSFGFISVIYVCTHWFPQNRWALMIGIANALGMLGAVIGEGPMSVAVENFGWRASMMVLGLIGLGLAVLMVLLVRNNPIEGDRFHQHTFLEGFKTVIKNYRSWIISIACGGYYSILAVFAALWCTPFLVKAYGVSTELASFASSMIFLGYVVGGPITGHFSDYLALRKLPLLFGSLGSGLLLIPIIYLTAIPFFWTFILLFILGFLTSFHLLTYTFAIELNPLHAKGSATALANTVVFVVASVMQPLVGVLLDWRSVGNEYTVGDYQFALMLIPISVFVSFIALFFLKDQKKSRLMSSKEHEAIVHEIQEEEEEAA